MSYLWFYDMKTSNITTIDYYGIRTMAISARVHACHGRNVASSSTLNADIYSQWNEVS